MVTETFIAAAPYGHIRGTASADRHEVEDFAQYLKRIGVLAERDFVAGIELVSVSQGDEQNGDVAVSALVCDLPGREALRSAVEAGPVKLRRISVAMPLNKFFGLFKQLSIRISPGGLLDGREVWVDQL